MMGHHDRSEALFYYFRLDDYVPENHLLRLIDKHVSLDFVRQQLKASHSDRGRPSIDPELLLRILLIGYLYGITSERKLVEELRMHLAWRWFTGLGFDQEIPHCYVTRQAGEADHASLEPVDSLLPRGEPVPPLLEADLQNATVGAHEPSGLRTRKPYCPISCHTG